MPRLSSLGRCVHRCSCGGVAGMGTAWGQGPCWTYHPTRAWAHTHAHVSTPSPLSRHPQAAGRGRGDAHGSVLWLHGLPHLLLRGAGAARCVGPGCTLSRHAARSLRALCWPFQTRRLAGGKCVPDTQHLSCPPVLSFAGVHLGALTPSSFGLVVAKGLLDNVLSDYLWARAILLLGACRGAALARWLRCGASTCACMSQRCAPCPPTHPCPVLPQALR